MEEKFAWCFENIEKIVDGVIAFQECKKTKLLALDKTSLKPSYRPVVCKYGKSGNEQMTRGQVEKVAGGKFDDIVYRMALCRIKGGLSVFPYGDYRQFLIDQLPAVFVAAQMLSDEVVKNSNNQRATSYNLSEFAKSVFQKLVELQGQGSGYKPYIGQDEELCRCVKDYYFAPILSHVLQKSHCELDTFAPSLNSVEIKTKEHTLQ